MESDSYKKRYKHAEIIRALRLLEGNNFNYLRTAKQLSLSRKTLKAWEKKYGPEIFSNQSPKEEALAEIDAEMKQYDINIIRYLYALRKRTLHKISIMAEKETRIEPLLNVLKFVTVEIERFTGIEKSEKDSSSTNIIAMITQYFRDKKQKSELPPEEHV